MLGQQFDDPKIDFYKSSWKFQIEKNENNDEILISIPTQNIKMTPEEITAKFLNYLVNDVGNRVLDQSSKTTACVIAVPANFTTTQRKAIKKAAKLAGLN